MVRKAIGLDCDNFYNIAVVGAAGTGKVSRSKYKHTHKQMLIPAFRAPWSTVS